MSERYERATGFEVKDFKAVGPRGEFEALVAVFGNVDLGGDRILPGAFAKSLTRWKESGDPIPVIWDHDWANPYAHIGTALEAAETDVGLFIHGTTDVEKPFAGQVYDLLADRRVKEFSFGYNVVDGERDDAGVFNLRELDLIEVSPTLKGMNPDTQLLAVKTLARAEVKAREAFVAPFSAGDLYSLRAAVRLFEEQLDADTKAGARLSKETRSTIQQAIDLMASLISADEAANSDPDDAKASGTASDTDSEVLTRLSLLKGGK